MASAVEEFVRLYLEREETVTDWYFIIVSVTYFSRVNAVFTIEFLFVFSLTFAAASDFERLFMTAPLEQCNYKVRRKQH